MKNELIEKVCLLELERISELAQMPTYGSNQAACFDLRADLAGRNAKQSDYSFVHDDGRVTLYSNGRALIPTGFIFHIADGYQLKINPRSGLAWKNGVTVLNAPATIDSDYKQELFIVLYNSGAEPFTICHGDRIAQAEIVPVLRVELDSLGDRKGGFGSSGVK